MSDLSHKTIKQLVPIAKRLGIETKGKVKSALITAIELAQGAGPQTGEAKSGAKPSKKQEWLVTIAQLYGEEDLRDLTEKAREVRQYLHGLRTEREYERQYFATGNDVQLDKDECAALDRPGCANAKCMWNPEKRFHWQCPTASTVPVPKPKFSLPEPTRPERYLL